jgi:hypothetical protein
MLKFFGIHEYMGKYINTYFIIFYRDQEEPHHQKLHPPNHQKLAHHQKPLPPHQKNITPPPGLAYNHIKTPKSKITYDIIIERIIVDTKKKIINDKTSQTPPYIYRQFFLILLHVHLVEGTVIQRPNPDNKKRTNTNI